MIGSLFYLNNDNLLHDLFQDVDRLGLAIFQFGPVFWVPNTSHKFVAGLGLRSLIPALFCPDAASLQPGGTFPRLLGSLTPALPLLSAPSTHRPPLPAPAYHAHPAPGPEPEPGDGTPTPYLICWVRINFRLLHYALQVRLALCFCAAAYFEQPVSPADGQAPTRQKLTLQSHPAQ